MELKQLSKKKKKEKKLVNASQNITLSRRSQAQKYGIIHTIRFHLYEILGKAKLERQRVDQWLAGMWVGGGGRETDCKGLFWGDANAILIVAVAAWLCSFVKICWTVYS